MIWNDLHKIADRNFFLEEGTVRVGHAGSLEGLEAEPSHVGSRPRLPDGAPVKMGTQAGVCFPGWPRSTRIRLSVPISGRS